MSALASTVAVRRRFAPTAEQVLFERPLAMAAIHVAGEFQSSCLDVGYLILFSSSHSKFASPWSLTLTLTLTNSMHFTQTQIAKITF